MGEGMFKPGWRRVTLGEVAINSTVATKDYEADGYTRYIIGKHIPEDGGRVTSWNPVGDAEFGSRIRTIVRAGDVICTTRGPKLKVAVAGFACLSAHTNFILRPKDSTTLLPGILDAVVRSEGFQEHLRKHFRGSTNLFVNWSDAARYELSLPPMEEQRRIAALLAAHSHLIESYNSLIDSISVTRRALGKQFFVVFPEGHKFSIGSVAEVRNGTTPSRNVKKYWFGSIPWLPTGKVNDRRIFSSDEFISETALAECSFGGVLPVGSCLVAMIGEGITRGKVARLELPACINQNFAGIVPGPSLDGWYLFYFLESHYESLRRWSQGSNQQALNCSLVRTFPIFVPALGRQGEMVVLLRDLDERESLATVRLADARARLRQVSTQLLMLGQ
jgi:type I restriction enzyme S subunit